MNITIIGSGNAAYVLGRMMVKAGHSIAQVYGRNEGDVIALADELGTKVAIAMKHIAGDADLYLIAVSDGSIAKIAAELRLKDKLVVHTAGSVSKDVLADVSANFGVLYPLQSLRKELGYLPEIPFLVDGSSENVKEKLIAFAKTLSDNISEADDQQRLNLHVAAVIVSNFTNHLFTLTKDFCDKEKVDFKFLLPLIQETVNRVHKYEPAAMQTGPAIRRDRVTVKKHLLLLKSYVSLKKIYKRMSESIVRTKR